VRLRIQQSYDNKAVQLIVSFAVSDRDVSKAEDTNIVLAWLNHLTASLISAYGKTEEVMASGLMGQNTCLFRGASSLILCFAFGSSPSIQNFGDGLGTSGTSCSQRQAHKFLSPVIFSFARPLSGFL
jgi:hypothetical protein